MNENELVARLEAERDVAIYVRVEDHLGFSREQWDEMSEGQRAEAWDDYYTSPEWNWEQAEEWEHVEGYIEGLNFVLGLISPQLPVI